MPQRYSVTPQPIETLLTWVKSGEIAVPEIQRPFVWEATKVRNLLDSLYQGYPIGYLIVWRNPTIKLKDGSLSAGKRILIDGQQRITALMASLLGMEILNSDYETTKIRIAFHPVEERFEVANVAIERDPAWLPNIAEIFSPNAKLLDILSIYKAANPSINEHQIFNAIENLKKIVHNTVGVIELADDLTIETVTEIFIRVNSAGAELSQADFAMSKIAANEIYGGNLLRKAIDYFCHVSVAPDFYAKIAGIDSAFAATDYYKKMSWLKDSTDDLFDPSYTDMLRVAFTSEFKRGKLQDLVALLSGRNFATKQFESAIAQESFKRLRDGVLNFMNRVNFDRFLMIIKSGGFVQKSLISSMNAINFAYIIYLRGREEKVASAKIERLVRRWLAFALLTGRYSGSSETQFDLDIRQIESHGVFDFVETVTTSELTDGFWEALLPINLETSYVGNPAFLVFSAAQIKMKDKGFLSHDIMVEDLITHRADVHHLFPRAYLKGLGMTKNLYNQVANYAHTQSEINIAIGATPPEVYFQRLCEQVNGGKCYYPSVGIKSMQELQANLTAHCIPDGIFNSLASHYEEFLEIRRRLIAQKLRQYFSLL